MPCRTDCAKCGHWSCTCDRSRAHKLEKELCEARSVIYQLVRILPRIKGLVDYSDASDGLKSRIDRQLEEHKKHRQEEKEVAEKNKKREIQYLKRTIERSDVDNKRRKIEQLEKELDDLDEIDSNDEKFWDREGAAFTP